MRSLVVLALLGSTAWAQSPGSPPPSPSGEQPVPEVEASEPAPPQTIDLGPGDEGYRSPATALVLSLGFTVGGAGLTWAASRGRGESKGLGELAGSLMVIVGPTTGHMYAGQTWNRGLKWRLLSVGAMAVTGVPLLMTFGSRGEQDMRTGEVLLVVFAVEGAAYVGATAYEIGTAPRAAREHNHRHGRASVALVPVLGRDPGLAVVGQF